METQKKTAGKTAQLNSRIERLEKYSEAMVREAFIKSEKSEDFEVVVLDYNGERTLALVFKKNTKMGAN